MANSFIQLQHCIAIDNQGDIGLYVKSDIDESINSGLVIYYKYETYNSSKTVYPTFEKNYYTNLYKLDIHESENPIQWKKLGVIHGNVFTKFTHDRYMLSDYKDGKNPMIELWIAPDLENKYISYENDKLSTIYDTYSVVGTAIYDTPWFDAFPNDDDDYYILLLESNGSGRISFNLYDKTHDGTTINIGWQYFTSNTNVYAVPVDWLIRIEDNGLYCYIPKKYGFILRNITMEPYYGENTICHSDIVWKPENGDEEDPYSQRIQTPKKSQYENGIRIDLNNPDANFIEVNLYKPVQGDYNLSDANVQSIINNENTNRQERINIYRKTRNDNDSEKQNDTIRYDIKFIYSAIEIIIKYNEKTSNGITLESEYQVFHYSIDDMKILISPYLLRNKDIITFKSYYYDSPFDTKPYIYISEEHGRSYYFKIEYGWVSDENFKDDITTNLSTNVNTTFDLNDNKRVYIKYRLILTYYPNDVYIDGTAYSLPEKSTYISEYITTLIKSQNNTTSDVIGTWIPLTNKQFTNSFDIIVKGDVEFTKAVDCITYNLSEIKNWKDVNYFAEEDLNRDFSGEQLQIYSDEADTGVLDIDIRNKNNSPNNRNGISLMNPADYKYPFFSKGLWHFNYIREKLDESPTTIEKLNKTYSDNRSLIYGKYLVIRFKFSNNIKFKFETLSVKSNTY